MPDTQSTLAEGVGFSDAELMKRLDASLWNMMAACVDRRGKTGDEWWFDLADRMALVRVVLAERHAPMAESQSTELTDEEIERIHDEAEAAAESCWYVGQGRNPYPEGSERAEIWSFAFRQAYARENS